MRLSAHDLSFVAAVNPNMLNLYICDPRNVFAKQHGVTKLENVTKR